MHPNYKPPLTPLLIERIEPRPAPLRLALSVGAGTTLQFIFAFVEALALGFAMVATGLQVSAFAMSVEYQLLDLVAMFVFQVPAGYIASSIAKSRPILVCFLVSCLTFALALAIQLLGATTTATWQNIAFMAVLVAAPPVGGWLWLVRRQMPNPSIERDVQGLSPLAAPHVKR